MRMPIYPIPVAWTNQTIVLYHGTLERHAQKILQGVVVAGPRTRLDFGRGFYTTTWRDQAVRWAIDKAKGNPPERPCVVSFSLPRERLAELSALEFVRSAVDAEDFWSFVYHCRTTGHHHLRVNHDFYDYVVGPVMASTMLKRCVHRDYDQISFHTDKAAVLLDSSNPVIEYVG